MADTTKATDAVHDTDLSGRQLGDFHLLRRLGRGAMAEVYLAEQASLRRQVAIKVLKSSLATDVTYVQRFHNEAQAAASLVHANIVQIHDVGCVDGIHFIAQEYVQGQNLQELMVRRGPPELRLALAIMRQVTAALHKAASAGIVHRDIKPENIMLARTGEVKVADFGLARITAPGASVNLTQVGITLGTPLYMSPEQVEGRTLDPRSDIYSFGVTSYQMLAGAPPFRGETALAIAVQHLKTQPERLEIVRPDLPPTLCRIVHKMLAKQPDQRYATPRELLQDLRTVRVEGDDGEWPDEFGEADSTLIEALAAGQAATERLGAIMQTASMQAVRRRRARVWLGAAAVAGLVLGGLAGWFSRPPFLLADARQSLIPRQNSAREQLFFAKTNGTEEWLKSVELYYKEDEDYVRLARQELARLYLLQDRRPEARAVFNDFTNLDDRQASFRAFGLAGNGILLARDREYHQSLELLAELWPMSDKLDRRMGRMVQDTLKANQDAIQEQISQKDAEISARWLGADFSPRDEG